MPAGNVLLTGSFGGTADFDPGSGTANLTSNGDADVFLAKYDVSGNYIWAYNFGGTTPDVGQSIATDASGNVLMTGYFNGIVDFDPGSGTANHTSTAGSRDIFLAKYTTGVMPCNAPGGLFVDRNTPSSARLNWNSVNANGYEIRGKNITSLSWTNLMVSGGSTSFRDVFGLPNNTTFVWQIRSFCGGNNIPTVWSLMDTFQTGCFQPDSSWTPLVSATAARLSWSDVSGAFGYEILGQRVGASGWTSIMASQFVQSKDVFGLSPATSYQWMIRTLCNQSGTLQSPFTSLVQFTTNSSIRSGQPGVFETFESVSVSVSPNPFTNRLCIKAAEGEAIYVHLFDRSGKLLVQASSEIGEITLPRNSLPSGLYFLETSYRNGSVQWLKVVAD